MKVELDIKEDKYEIRKGVFLNTGDRIVIKDIEGIHEGIFLKHELNVFDDPNGGPFGTYSLLLADDRRKKVVRRSEALAQLIARSDMMRNWRFFGVGDGPELGQECLFYGGVGNNMLYLIRGGVFDSDRKVVVTQTLGSGMSNVAEYLNDSKRWDQDNWRRKFYIFAPCVSKDGRDISLDLVKELRDFLIFAR